MSSLNLCYPCLGQSLALLFSANAAPILAKDLLAQSGRWAIDGGLRLSDGRRLFGHTKTWRGLIAAILLTGLCAWFVGLPVSIGMYFGFLSMCGDLLSSFCKRRMAFSESSHARGWDTLPESCLPCVFLASPLGIGLFETILLICLFFLLEELISPILYKLHIRNRPY